MVDDLRGTNELSGFYVGLMASIYMAGQTLAAMIFPQLSDTVVGRKKSIIFGHFALTLPMLMFGLSRTYWEAFFWRFLNGALQCNRPITNAVIAEITDETNQAKAYGLGAMSWGTATMLGPSLGGLLAFPATLYPSLFSAAGVWGRLVPEALADLWSTFPYLLPCVVAVLWAMVGLIATIVCLPDDRPAVSWLALVTGRVDRDDPESWATSADDGRGAKAGEEEESLLGVEDSSDGVTQHTQPISPRAKNKMSYCAMLKDRELGPAIQVYMWANTVWVIYMELLPLFGKARPEQGGVGFQPQQIGVVLTITAVVVMFYQPCIFPRISNGLGVVRMVQMGGIVALLMLFGFPFMTLLARQPVRVFHAVLLTNGTPGREEPTLGFTPS